MRQRDVLFWLKSPDQGRANRFLVGGGGREFQNLRPLPFQGPPKNVFGKAKNFPGNVRDGGGGGQRYVFENKSFQNISQNNISLKFP